MNTESERVTFLESWLGIDNKKNKSIIQSKFLKPRGQRFVECNLCGRSFKVKSRFERFCQECKLENEEYHAYDAFN